jgi:predicted DNA-binding protein
MNVKDHISIRLNPDQYLVVKELSTCLNTSMSLLIRTIIGDWLYKNEDYLYKIIDKKKYGDAIYKQNTGKEDIFGDDEE